MTDREKREAIDWLYRLKSEINCCIPRARRLPFLKAIDFAISSIKTDRAFDLAYEDSDWPQRWIPIEEQVPEVDEDGCSKYILISCSNFSLPTIGRYQQDKDGSGAFYDGDDDRKMASYGLMVNAWMPLPDTYPGD